MADAIAPQSPNPAFSLPPLSGTPLVITTFALSMAVFMMVLDSTIANVALCSVKFKCA